MDADFPAAHSMDTMWFAVDRDGRVGCFDSGEAGAVPDRAFGDESSKAAYKPLLRLPVSGEVIYDLSGHEVPFDLPGRAPRFQRPVGEGIAH